MRDKSRRALSACGDWRVKQSVAQCPVLSHIDETHNTVLIVLCFYVRVLRYLTSIVIACNSNNEFISKARLYCLLTFLWLNETKSLHPGSKVM